MPKKKLAVFCHLGLGDGVVSTILSNNFHQNHWETVTYHDTMLHLQSWFPHLPIACYPQIASIPQILEENDLILVFQNDTHEFVLELIKEGKKQAPEKLRVFYPYPSKNIFHSPYYNDSRINPTISFVDNLYLFCKELIGLDKTTKNNGMIAPRDAIFKKHEKRVVMHIASSRAGKNWPIKKFLALGRRMLADGFTVALLAGIEKLQKPFFPFEKEGFLVPKLFSLHEVAKYIYESGYHIGNDSGLGHLASAMGIDTVTIARRKTVGLFWRPGWGNNEYVTPLSIIPNISGLRIRDTYWKNLISHKKVYRHFLKLVKTVT
ncbi:MAG: glycosyltransferase family 9 protein [Chlamydiota bacterium]